MDANERHKEALEFLMRYNKKAVSDAVEFIADLGNLGLDMEYWKGQKSLAEMNIGILQSFGISAKDKSAFDTKIVLTRDVVDESGDSGLFVPTGAICEIVSNEDMYLIVEAPEFTKSSFPVHAGDFEYLT